MEAQKLSRLHLVSGSRVPKQDGIWQSPSLRPSSKHIGINLQALLTRHPSWCSSKNIGLSVSLRPLSAVTIVLVSFAWGMVIPQTLGL